jgi:hypothetical protein
MNRRRLTSVLAAWAIPACAVATIGLGLSGWLAHGFRVDEALYRATALFGVAHDYYRTPPGITDWRFRIGRWTGLVTVFGAALLTVGAVLHERVVVALAQLVRHEVIVVGVTGFAAKAFDAARRAGESVVWVGASAVEAASLNSLALPWPPEDHVRTILKYVGDARHILLAQDDDAAALVLARAARSAAPKAFVTVLLQDARLAEDAAEMISHPHTRVLSAATVSARALHIDHPPFLAAQQLGHERIHALVVGFGQMGQAVARDLIVNCRTTYLRLPRITVIDPAAPALEGVLRVRAPEVDRCAEFSFVQGAIGARRIEPDTAALAASIAAGGPVTVAYVCVGTDSEGLGAVGMLQSLLRTANLGEPPIFVRLSDADATVAASGRNAGRGLNAVIPFGDLDSIISATEFLSDAPDHAARAFSDAYRALLPPEKRNDAANRSAYPWEALDEAFRQSTRDAVAHIPAKMASAGIDPTFWVGVRGPPWLPPEIRLFTSEAERERLAELEHERWNAERRMDGWRWADMPAKDERRRLHPQLAPFGQLSEDAKAYDRAIVRETQEICWRMPGESAQTALKPRRVAARPRRA